ncbi:MAG TPA: molybdopterin-dependent oxidoreductase [Desulfobacteraceae bacterium]|nr:molybdopterin-dependent oxidoreductase [Desulfobacteraceae bacterium]
MTRKQVSVSCPMDCYDLCRFTATVENNRIVNLKADKNHPVTKGFSCKKGSQLVERMNHPHRIRSPLIKKEGEFVNIGYDEVLGIIADRLVSIKNRYGPEAVLNYSGDGYGGVKNRIQTIFFNCFGGASSGEGSLCWGAGMAAQQYDFGSVKGHFPDDVLNAKTVLVWGRNPKFTNLHLYRLLLQAEASGSSIIVIDPLETETAKAFGRHIRPRPSTDGALALAMANWIIENNCHNRPFVEKHVVGFHRFKEYASAFTPARAEEITGVPGDTIRKLARQYAEAAPGCIYIGYGLQRYRNGGNTIRCIDALGAITGNIGRKGGGVNYAAKSLAAYLSGVEQESRTHAEKRRTFLLGRLGEFLQGTDDPPVKAVFVAGSNPLTQSPDLENTVESFKQVDFKVVFDHFLTDTARQADIVLPAASVFEQDDLFVTSMYSPVLNVSQKAVEPPPGVMPEFDVYLALARRVGGLDMGFSTSGEYLRKSAQPLLDRLGVDFESLASGYPRIEQDAIAWQEGRFETPSGKIELYSERAGEDGLSFLPSFLEPESGTTKLPLRLLTCHTLESMHSQGFAFNGDLPMVYINSKTAGQFGVDEQRTVLVRGEKQAITARLTIDDAVCDTTALIYQGWWHASGAVNFLTEPRISDMGGQAAYYDSFCAIEKTV